MPATAVVIGIGSTGFGVHPGRTADDLAVQAVEAALVDAGLAAHDLDGLITQRVSSYETIAARLGISPAFSLQVPAEGRMTGPAIALAARAVEAGECTAVVLAYGNDSRSGGHTYGGLGATSSVAAEGYGSHPELHRAYGLTSPGAFYALMLQRYEAEFGSASAALETIAVTFRDHAIRNPGAAMSVPLTPEEYRASRAIVRPMRLHDYCMINDGGVAMVVTTAERAADLPGVAVQIAGWGQQSRLASSDLPPADYWRTAARAAHERAHRMAGTTVDDLDVAMIYDNFSPNVLFTLEGMGVCGPGEAADWVVDQGVGTDAPLPLNTAGGHLSEGYMQGWALNVEAVRQVRGDAVARPARPARLVAYAATAPVSSTILYRRSGEGR
ncbi:hypothetical protein ACGFIG_29080 [Micromonospora sp. NPDC049048]|uniref:thiolase C-terminal domain-containing protein n=1 Tax=Micromonospora sp. NPDC049048 TaxID=3364263 RepID=UPI003714879A